MRQKIIKIVALTTAAVITLATIIAPVFASDGSHTEDETTAMEDIMKGLSTFKYKVYEWPDNLTVGGLSFSFAEKLYDIRDTKTKDPVLWNDKTIEKDMKTFYSSTDWNQFTGMLETVEIGNHCEAVLTDEVAKYEELMDEAARKYGFSVYAEIFKAIAQARFNENKTDYDVANRKGYIHGTGDDLFDLFHIDGSWIDGGDTPVGAAKVPTPTPKPASGGGTPGSTGTPSPTPMPESGEAPIEAGISRYTVQQSIDIAAQAFSSILQDAVYPSPYDTNSLIGVVQGFEFGGRSNAIRAQFNSSPISLDVNGFITFAEYFDMKTLSAGDDIDYDSIIEAYAKVVAHGNTRASSDTDTYGKYKYSDQKFYEKVFENYRCNGGGSIEYGNLPDDMKEILRMCMQTWDSRVTDERRAIIQNAVSLYGVTYSMDARNSPSVENPQYLDCSSFVGQCYWRAGLMGQEAAWWCTGDFSANFQQIGESQLIPGDIGQITWNPGGSGGSEHIGIYIGTVNGTKYWIHCAGGYTDGVYHAPGKGVKVNDYGGFIYYGRMPGLN